MLRGRKLCRYIPILSEVINIGQNKHNNSILQPRTMFHTKFQVIWCISKDIKFLADLQKMWGRVTTPVWCLKAQSGN